MPITIAHSVIHGFEKTQHAAVVTSVTKKNSSLDCSLPAVRHLVEGTANLLGRRLNAQTWGRFDDVNRAGPYRGQLLNHTANLHDSLSFIAMTHTAMDEIVIKAGQKSASTGSHILFAQFTDEDNVLRLLIAMIKQKGGIQLDHNFVPIGITEIDMSKLSQAADIRLAEFTNSLEVNVLHEVEEVHYLSFLSQRDSDEASSYFIKALGCVIGVTPKQATAMVFCAVDEFMQLNPALRLHKKNAREKVVEYLESQLASGSNANLAGIVHAVTTALPPELVHHAEELDVFLNGEKYKVPTEFFVHKEALKKFTKIKIDSDEMQLRFNRTIVGKTEGAKVYFNKEERSLKISDLSASMIEKLEKQLEG